MGLEQYWTEKVDVMTRVIWQVLFAIQQDKKWYG